MDIMTKTYSAREIVSLDADTFITTLLGWALDAQTLAQCLTEGDYGQDAAKAFEDRRAHSLIISTIWCESRMFRGLPGTDKALAMIDAALVVDPFPAFGAA